MPATTVAKMKVSSTLLACSRALVDNNFNKIMQLVTEAWETSQNIVSFGKRENDLLEHLEANLKNDRHFCDRVLTPFANHVVNTSELKRRQENLPSPKRTKKVKACWQKKVNNLQLIVESCKQAICNDPNPNSFLESLTTIDLLMCRYLLSY
jgi:hypothetical protein